jgi:hypothetical protein
VAAASRRLNRAAVAGTDEILPRVRARLSEATARYARDPFAHLEDGHIVVLDLETLRPTLLDPWPNQVDLLADWIDLDYLTRTGRPRFRNVHEIKSRRMGITWVIAYACAWALRWHGVRGLALSMKLGEIVDSGWTTDSFFGRVKYIAEYRDSPEAEPVGGWPDHLRPRFRYAGGNDPVIVGQSDGYLTGSGAVADPGRGGGYDYMFLDEFARVSFGRSVQASVSRACPAGRLYNSTVEGEDNEFWQLRVRRPRGYTFRRDHWSTHPIFGKGQHIAAKLGDDGSVEQAGDPSCPLCLGTLAGLSYRPSEPVAHRYPGKLTSPWYDAATVDLDDASVAAELDIDPTAALTARVYPEFVEERHVAAIEIPLVPNVPVELGFDYGETTAVLICQDTPREYRVVGEVEMTDALPESVARAIRAELLALGLGDRDVSQAATLALVCRGDPAGEARDQGTGRSITDDYRREGFAISSMPLRVEPSIRAVKRLLGGRPKELVVSQRCPQLIYHMKHYRREVDRRGNPKPSAKPDKAHGHDHMPDAFRYITAWRFPSPETSDAVAEATALRARPDDGGRLDSGLSYETQL